MSLNCFGKSVVCRAIPCQSSLRVLFQFARQIVVRMLLFCRTTRTLFKSFPMSIKYVILTLQPFSPLEQSNNVKIHYTTTVLLLFCLSIAIEEVFISSRDFSKKQLQFSIL